MTLRVIEPSIGETLALYTEAGMAKSLHVKAAILQGARADAIGFADGSGVVAVALLYPLTPEKPGEDLAELVFACRPAAAAHLVGIIRTARLTRDLLAHTPGVRIRATVAEGYRPGQRLAALCGLTCAGGDGRFERWEWASSSKA